MTVQEMKQELDCVRSLLAIGEENEAFLKLYETIQSDLIYYARNLLTFNGVDWEGVAMESYVYITTLYKKKGEFKITPSSYVVVARKFAYEQIAQRVGLAHNQYAIVCKVDSYAKSHQITLSRANAYLIAPNIEQSITTVLNAIDFLNYHQEECRKTRCCA